MTGNGDDPPRLVDNVADMPPYDRGRNGAAPDHRGMKHRGGQNGPDEQMLRQTKADPIGYAEFPPDRQPDLRRGRAQTGENEERGQGDPPSEHARQQGDPGRQIGSYDEGGEAPQTRAVEADQLVLPARKAPHIAEPAGERGRRPDGPAGQHTQSGSPRTVADRQILGQGMPDRVRQIERSEGVARECQRTAPSRPGPANPRQYGDGTVDRGDENGRRATFSSARASDNR